MNESPVFNVLSFASEDKVNFAGFCAAAATESKTTKNVILKTDWYIRGRAKRNYIIFKTFGA